MKKLLYEDVKKVFSDVGCELLDREYTSSSKPLKYRCNCGNISTVYLQGFKRGRRCKKCYYSRKNHHALSLKNVQKFFKDNGCVLLSKKYINNKTKLDYICGCGEKSSISFTNFQNGKRCKRCGIDKFKESKKLKCSEVKLFFSDNGCVLLEQEYKGCQFPMKYTCVCKRESVINFSDFKNGHRCKKCAIEKNIGKGNPNWNSNLTDEERKIKRFYPEYKKWRTDIYVKDDYTCQRCSQRGGVLNAHHILNYSSNKELRTKISNGITLCDCCHKKFHFIYGKKDNNKAQLNSFLKKDFVL